MLPYNPGYHPPCPQVRINIIDNNAGWQLSSIDALIDTGADFTCIPATLLPIHQGYQYNIRSVTDYNGQPQQVTFLYILQATVEILDDQGHVIRRENLQNLELLILNHSTEALLGRDILNKQIWEFDGPALQAFIR